MTIEDLALNILLHKYDNAWLNGDRRELLITLMEARELAKKTMAAYQDIEAAHGGYPVCHGCKESEIDCKETDQCPERPRRYESVWTDHE